MPSPRPLAPPVMSATFPSNLPATSSSPRSTAVTLTGRTIQVLRVQVTFKQNRSIFQCPGVRTSSFA